MGVGGWLLGFVLGMRHSLEPDHLAAVGTLLPDGPAGRRGGILGAFWGLGHTLSLLLLGGLFAALQARMPARLSDGLELGVAGMLLVLGLRALASAAREPASAPATLHAHHGIAHRHGDPGAHVHLGSWTFAWRPLLVGLVHGAAGSGVFTALVLAGLHSTLSRLVYIALFGLGSLLGMAALSGAAGASMGLFGGGRGVRRGLSLVAGALSLGLGIAWGWPLVSRLFA